MSCSMKSKHTRSMASSTSIGRRLCFPTTHQNILTLIGMKITITMKEIIITTTILMTGIQALQLSLIHYMDSRIGSIMMIGKIGITRVSMTTITSMDLDMYSHLMYSMKKTLKRSWQI